MIGFPVDTRWLPTTSEINFKQCSKQKTTDGRQQSNSRQTDRRGNRARMKEREGKTVVEKDNSSYSDDRQAGKLNKNSDTPSTLTHTHTHTAAEQTLSRRAGSGGNWTCPQKFPSYGRPSNCRYVPQGNWWKATSDERRQRQRSMQIAGEKLLRAFSLHWKQEATCRKLFHFNYAKGRAHTHTYSHAQPNWVLYNAAGRAEMWRHFVCTNEITSQPAGAFLLHHLCPLSHPSPIRYP